MNSIYKFLYSWETLSLDSKFIYLSTVLCIIVHSHHFKNKSLHLMRLTKSIVINMIHSIHYLTTTTKHKLLCTKHTWESFLLLVPNDSSCGSDSIAVGGLWTIEFFRVSAAFVFSSVNLSRTTKESSLLQIEETGALSSVMIPLVIQKCVEAKLKCRTY